RVRYATGIGYARDDLVDAWLRYLPSSPAEAEQAEQAEQASQINGFPCSGSEDVPDSQQNTPSDRNGNSSMKSTRIPDVPDVPLVAVDLNGRKVALHDTCQPSWADNQ